MVVMDPPEGQQYVSAPHRAVLAWPKHTLLTHAPVPAAPDHTQSSAYRVSRGKTTRLLLAVPPPPPQLLLLLLLLR